MKIGKNIVVISVASLLLLSSCSWKFSIVNDYPETNTDTTASVVTTAQSSKIYLYYDKWLKHESESLRVRVKFQEYGKVYFNFMNDCCIKLLVGDFVANEDNVEFIFETGPTTLVPDKVPFYVDDGVLYLSMKEEPLSFLME